MNNVGIFSPRIIVKFAPFNTTLTNFFCNYKLLILLCSYATSKNLLTLPDAISLEPVSVINSPSESACISVVTPPYTLAD
nr:MAG TPA: hypothetical protein [Caudoviricetes sp.]